MVDKKIVERLGLAYQELPLEALLLTSKVEKESLQMRQRSRNLCDRNDLRLCVADGTDIRLVVARAANEVATVGKDCGVAILEHRGARLTVQRSELPASIHPAAATSDAALRCQQAGEG